MRSGRDFVRGASYDERRSSAQASAHTYNDAYFSRTTFKLVAIFIFFTCCVIARLVWLQVVDAQRLTHMAQTQRTNVVKLFARRGTIYDRNGNVLAISRECKTLYCNPQQVKDPSGALIRLTPTQHFLTLLKKLVTKMPKQSRSVLQMRRSKAFFFFPILNVNILMVVLLDRF